MCGASAPRTRSEPSAPPPSAITPASGRESSSSATSSSRARKASSPSLSKKASTGSPEPLLELAVGIERLRAELGGERASAGGLAGAHETDEHECYARLQPMRSSYAASAAFASSMWSPPSFSR